MWNVNRSLALLAPLLLLVSCAKYRASVAIKAPEVAHGEVSFKFLADEDSGIKQDPHGWEYHPPRLRGEAVMPSYPEQPLTARFGSALVIVRIAINSAGEVTDVSPDPDSTEGPFAADFFHAIDTAVRKWKFTRPEWWLLEEGSDINGDGKPDYQKVIEVRPAVASGNMEFLFELIDDQGKVQ
jgi:hypothetical protein